jgi:lipid II:glycine glycyltransferase (peptidoglycan interpeptide bridge formation enzyme)
MLVREIGPGEKEVWNNFIARSACGHVVQSWEWGEFKKQMGNPPTRLGVFDNQVLLATAQYTLHPVPKTPFFIGYLPKGPVCDKNLQETLPEILSAIRKTAQSQNCLLVRLEPNIYSDNRLWVDSLVSWGLKKSPKDVFAPHNFYLDLTKSEKELLSIMHPKWRYNIRLAERKGVKVREESNEEGLKKFLNLQRETARRDGFFVHPDSYYQKLFQVLQPAGMAYLLNAYKEGNSLVPLVSWLFFKFGQTLYYPYGASASFGREVMPSHAMMWAAINLGKKLGCTRFDLWGAAAPNAPADDPYTGFTKFKEGFRPARVSYLGAYDLVINLLGYKIFNFADKLRWTILKLKSKV